jgi:hypothetical protein
MTEPLLPWGQLGVSELSLTYDQDLRRYLMVTLPAFSNKVCVCVCVCVGGWVCVCVSVAVLLLLLLDLSPTLSDALASPSHSSNRPIPPFSLHATTQVFLWSAESITGPWTGSTLVDVEEFEAAFQQQAGYRTGQKQRLFYSAKLHPELAAVTTRPTGAAAATATATAAAGGGGGGGGSGGRSRSDLFFASLQKTPTTTEEEEKAASAAVSGGVVESEKGKEKELVVSYCANVLGDWPAPADYTPRFVRVSLRRGEKGAEGTEGGVAVTVAAAGGGRDDL